MSTGEIAVTWYFGIDLKRELRISQLISLTRSFPPGPDKVTKEHKGEGLKFLKGLNCSSNSLFKW